MSFLQRRKKVKNYVVFSYKYDDFLSIFLTTEEFFDKIMQYAFDKGTNEYFSIKDMALTEDSYLAEFRIFFSKFGKKIKFKKVPDINDNFCIGGIPSILKEYLDEL